VVKLKRQPPNLGNIPKVKVVKFKLLKSNSDGFNNNPKNQEEDQVQNNGYSDY
jgi:hypothetical protein